MAQQARKILIVDNFPQDREIYRRYLLADPDFSYQILEASSASAGLALCQRQQIDGILLEYVLPDLNGLEFLASLKTQYNGNCPPVVMLTGQGNEGIAVRAIKSGAEDYLVKEQTKPEELRSSMRCAIENNRLRGELQASEERFRISVENMLDCFGIYSAIRDESGQIVDFRIDYLNPAALQSNRMTKEDIGKRLCQLLPGHYESGLFAEYCIVVETGQPLLKECLEYTDVFSAERLTRAYDLSVAKLGDGIVVSWRDITDKKQTEIALQESERRFRAIFDGTFQFIGLLNTDGILLEANQTALEFGGITREEVINRPFWLARWWTTSPETQLQLKQAIECAAAGVLVRYEVDVLGAGDRIITIDFSLKPVRDETGKVVLIIPEGRDITERKNIEAQLKESQHFIQRIAETSPGILYVYDLIKQCNVYVNRQVTELLGYTKEQIQAMGTDLLPTLIHPDDFAATPAHMALFDSAKDGDILEREYRMQHAKGEWRWFLGRETVFSRNADGTPLQILGITQDITSRLRTQAELFAAIEKFELAAAAVNCLIYDWDVEKGIVDRTHGLTRLLGYTLEETEPSLEWWGDRIHPEDFQKLRRDRLNASLSETKRYCLEYRVRHKDGHYIWVEDRGIVVHSRDGRPIRVVGSTANITERKQAEEEIQRLNLELQRRVDELQTLFDIIPVGIAIAQDPKCEVIRANAFAANMLTVPPDTNVSATAPEAERLPYKQLRDGKEIPGSELPMQLATTYGVEVRDVEIQLVRADGVTLDFWINAKPLFDEQGIVRGCIAAFTDITEAKLAQEALRRSEEKLAFIINNVNASISRFWVFANKDWKHDYYSSGCKIIFGYTSEELVTNKNLWLSRVLPEDVETIIFPKFADITAERTVSYEYRFNHFDGSLRWISETLTSQRDRSEDAWIVTAIATDITERKQAEAALRQSEARFQRLAANVPGVIYQYILRADGSEGFTYISPKSSEIYEHKPEVLLQDFRLVWTMIHPDDVPRVRDVNTISYQNLENFDVEFRLIPPSGRLKWVQAKSQPQRLANGDVIYDGLVMDITGRKQAEEAIRQSEALFRGVFESNLIGILFWNSQGQITNANDTFIRMTGYTRESMQAGEVYYKDITPPEYHELDAQKIEQLYSDGTYDPIEKEYICKNGSRLTILLGCAFLPGFRDRGVAFVLDISEQKRLRQELETLLASAQAAREEALIANRTKDEFLAVVSHELRSPLNSVLGWAKLLQTRNCDPVTTKRALETIERNTKSQCQLIEDLLDISRMIKGNLRLELASVNLTDVIEASIDIVRPTALAKQIQIEFVEIKQTNPNFSFIVSGDFNRLQQIAINLLTNAVKFTPNGGKVQVKLSVEASTEIENKNVKITISDTGKGISPDFLPYVFDRFRQASNTTTRAKDGLGLGLAIVRNLVELHNGTVTATSPGEGQGATFTVKLPLISDNT